MHVKELLSLKEKVILVTGGADKFSLMSLLHWSAWRYVSDSI